MEQIVLMDKAKPSISEDYLVQKKIEFMIDINNKRIFVELNKINNIISKLDQEISVIKKHISENQIIPAPNTGKASNVPSGNKNGDKDLGKPIDRNGIAPSDVSIEKFFYFGKA